MSQGLVDTSVWIGLESGRPVHRAALPENLRVSVVTLAELEAGVLAASSVAIRQHRLHTLAAAAELLPLPIDGVVAAEWARLRVEIAGAKRRVNVNDLWIAATARANRLPVVTQDDDFDVLSSLGLVTVIKV